MTGGPHGRLSVLLVCGSFELGGSERNVVQIATGLDRELFAVTVLGLSGAGPLRVALAARPLVPAWLAGSHLLARTGGFIRSRLRGT